MKRVSRGDAEHAEKGKKNQYLLNLLRVIIFRAFSVCLFLCELGVARCSSLDPV
jgi:hypothetical protein